MNTSWSKTTKYIVAVGLVLLGIYILSLSRSVISLLVVAALVAVVVRPAILWLHNHAHLPRGLAVVLVYLVVLILAPLAIVLAVPAVIDAVRYILALDYPSILQSSLEWLRTTLTSIKAANLPVAALDSYVDQAIDALLAELQRAPAAVAPALPSIGTLLQSLGMVLSTTFSTAVGLAGTLVSSIVLFIFVFLTSVYISLGAHTYKDSFLRLVPEPYKPEISVLIARIEHNWSAFFRGELTLMLIIGLLSFVGLAVLGVPGALYLGIVSGLLEIVPNLGPVIATIPAVIVALLQGSTYLPVSNMAMALIVIALFIIIQQMENSLIVPRVLGGAVELPALIVMSGVLVGGSVAGILGTLLATPVIATAREILRYAYRKLLSEDPFPLQEVTLSPQPPLPLLLIQPPSLRLWVRRLSGTRIFPSPQKPPPPDLPNEPDAEPSPHQE